MAITFTVAGTSAGASSGNVTPGLPSGWAADDIHCLVISAIDNVVITLPAGWTKEIELNNGTGQRLTFAWRRAVAGDTDPLVTHTAGSQIVAQISGFRGAVTSGDPFDAFASQANASSVTITAPTITPLNANDMILFVGIEGAGDNVSGYSGTNPTFAEAMDTAFGVFPGVGECLAYGIKTDTSATGSRTATNNGAAINCGALLSMVASLVSPDAVSVPLMGAFHPGRGPSNIGRFYQTPRTTYDATPPLADAITVRIQGPYHPGITPLRGARFFKSPLSTEPTQMVPFMPDAVTAWIAGPMHPGRGPTRNRHYRDQRSTVVTSGPTLALVTLAITATGTPAFFNQPWKFFAVTSTTTALFVKQPNKVFAVTATGTPTLLKTPIKLLTVTATGTATLLKQVARVLAVTSSGAPTILKQPIKVFAVTATGTPSVVRGAAKNLAVTATGTPAFIKQVARLLAVTATGTPLLGKRVPVTLAVTATGTAVLSAIKTIVAVVRALFLIGPPDRPIFNKKDFVRINPQLILLKNGRVARKLTTKVYLELQ